MIICRTRLLCSTQRHGAAGSQAHLHKKSRPVEKKTVQARSSHHAKYLAPHSEFMVRCFLPRCGGLDTVNGRTIRLNVLETLLMSCAESSSVQNCRRSPIRKTVHSSSQGFPEFCWMTMKTCGYHHTIWVTLFWPPPLQ